MKQSWIRFLCVVLLMLLPVFAVLASGFLLPAQFELTFLGEFDDKVARLEAANEPKIIVIGGSSAAFGVNTALLEDALDMPVINYGLYATLGTKVMMDTARHAIGAGDIILIAPEMNAQTWSLYFNAEAMWQALDGHFGLMRHLDSENAPAMFGGFWKFASSKLKYFIQKATPDPEGIYNASSFDEFGFIRYNRDKDYNIMVGGVKSDVIAFDPSIISEDFIDYVNEYTAFAEKKGAKVYLGFCPMNELAIASDTTLETLENFSAFLDERFSCDVLGDPNNYLYRSGYFYDSNFHTNSAGAVVHTRQLAIDLASILNKELAEDIAIPDEPEIPAASDEPDVWEYDENEVYFTYDVTKYGVYITGVTELGKAQSTLTTPTAYDGKKIVSFSEDTFVGCDALKELFVTKNISQIPDGTFRGAGSLEKIHILASDPDACTVNNVTMGAREGLLERSRFYVPAAARDAFATNYFWGPYANYIVGE